MFAPAPFQKGKAKLVAFKPDTFEHDNEFHRYYYGYGHSFGIDAIWFSKSPSTLGSMVLGKVVYSIGQDLARPGFTMDYEGFKRAARTHDVANRAVETVRFDSRIVLSDTKIWGAGGENELEETKRAIHLWENLDALPEGWDGWYAFSNRVA